MTSKKQPDFLDLVCEKGKSDLTDKLLQVRKNAIPISFIDMENKDIPVGASKSGGYPDLPPSIPYPILAGFTETWHDGSVNQYAASAMQLVAQIRLEEAAPFDKDDLLPKTGMLYIFWSGKFPMQDSKFCKYQFEGNERAAYQIFYYDGDLSQLKRTKPTIPYYTKYFEKPFDAYRLQFDGCQYEYDIRELDEELDEIYDDYESYEVFDTKLLGHPVGSMNIQGTSGDLINLFQFDYHMGCLWTVYWYIDQKDLAERNFEHLQFDCDVD